MDLGHGPQGSAWGDGWEREPLLEFALGACFLAAPLTAVKKQNPQNSLSRELIIYFLHGPVDLCHVLGDLFAFLKSPGVCSWTDDL